MYVRSSASAYPGVLTAQRLTADGAKAVDMRALPGSDERAERLIDGLVRVTAGRNDSVKGYTANMQRQEDLAKNVSAIIAKLPAGTSQQERDAWTAKLADINNDIADSQGQIGFYGSLATSDPSRDSTMSFAARLLGISVEDVHKLYNDKAAALDVETASAAAARASAAPATGETEWGSERSGLRAEIKVNGEVVGRVYNGGGAELKDAYGSLGLALFSGPGEEGLEGPDLADHRIAKLAAAFNDAKVEVIKASTALTQAQWAAQQASGVDCVA